MQPTSTDYLPKESKLLDFLKKEPLTKEIDLKVLKLVAKTLANQKYEKKKSINSVQISIDIMKVYDLDKALEICAKDKPLFNFDFKKLLNIKSEDPNIKYEKKALKLAKENDFLGCLKYIQSLDESNRNLLCETLAIFYAKRGHSNLSERIVEEIKCSLNPNSLEIYRSRNRLYATLTIILARHGFLEEAKKMILNISKETTVVDDTNFAGFETEMAWCGLIDILININQLEEAKKLLINVNQDNANRFKEKIQLCSH